MRLPFSLASAALALVASALTARAAELLVLTPETFDPTIANGMWLVEHFSPYCGHCKRFAPTWEKLIDLKTPGIHLAQVNCAVNGDLCDKNKVNGYPQLNLYKNGEFVEQYKKSRDFDLLKTYLEAHAEPSTPGAAAPAAPAAADAVSPPPPKTPGLDYNTQGNVLVLDTRSFDHTLKQGPAFVKFYAPWCGHCKRLAPHWTQLAHRMQHKLTIAEVDCEAQPALCKREGVTGYPMLFFYSASGSKTEYTGGRKLEQLAAFADKAYQPAIQELPEEGLEVKAKDNEVMFLFLHTNADSKHLNDLTIAAQSLLGSAPVFTSTSPLIHTYFSSFGAGLPALFVIKDQDLAQPIFAPATALTTSAAMNDWLQAHRQPSALELSAESFQGVMNAPTKPLVVLAAIPAGGTGYANQVREIGKQWKERTRLASAEQRQVLFAWMDHARWESWMKNMYGITEAPAVVIAEHHRLVYYDTDSSGEKIQLSSASVFSAIDGIIGGGISPIHSENLIERFARWLNDKLTAIETMVTNNPITTAFIVLCVLGLLIVALKRALTEETADFYPVEHADTKLRKSRRAD